MVIVLFLSTCFSFLCCAFLCVALFLLQPCLTLAFCRQFCCGFKFWIPERPSSRGVCSSASGSRFNYHFPSLTWGPSCNPIYENWKSFHSAFTMSLQFHRDAVLTSVLVVLIGIQIFCKLKPWMFSPQCHKAAACVAPNTVQTWKFKVCQSSCSV